MPISYTFEQSSTMIRVTVTGELTMSDYVGLRRAIEADAQIPSGCAVLFDLRDVEILTITGAEILALAQTRDSVENRARRIAVVVKDPVSFGLTRMYELSRISGPPLRVFREAETALHWLLDS